ncbi:diaminopimelate epimerase [Prosthecochloris sp.]|uniref:diaminopimelate epimerase n=1 Tax=Prosthecochloris sp. TaxID=290513 RepID=UPI00257B60D8|nr:diaminopimelate epimerase [Prosthecochloris sp.]
MQINFAKMSGAGNDFIVIDTMQQPVNLTEPQILSLCTRRTGIGADGLILIEPSETLDFSMRYYNADGKPGSMCGNGGRCAAYFAYTTGISGKTASFQANGDHYNAWITDIECVKLKMTVPDDFRSNFYANGFSCHFVNTGSPHTIIYTEELDTFNVENAGSAIRNNSTLFPEGTNVNFLEVTGPDTLSVRTFERGVEAETLACGTGAVAAALMSYKLEKVSSTSIRVTVRSGDTLHVDFSDDMKEVFLSGPAKVVYTGTVNV